MNSRGVQCSDNTKYQILTFYVLNVYKITHHNKQTKKFGRCIYAYKACCHLAIFCLGHSSESLRAYLVYMLLHNIFGFTYLILHFMLNTLSVLAFWVRDSICECIQIHLVVKEAPDSAKC